MNRTEITFVVLLAVGGLAFFTFYDHSVNADAHGTGSKYDNVAKCWSYDCDMVHMLHEISDKLDRLIELSEERNELIRDIRGWYP